MNREETATLEVVEVTKRYGDFVALDRVSLAVQAGTVTCILGPSGSGKSTLIRTINMLEPIDSGAIYYKSELLGDYVRGGQRIPLPQRKVRQQTTNFGMVFQSFNLFPNMTAIENVMLAPRTVKRLSRTAARELAMRELAAVGLASKVDNYPSELSGGQQQRVAIARALAMEPEVLLFDEPTSALDPELVGEVLDVIRALAARGATMVIVTHELRLALDVATDVVVMHDGQIIEMGAPDQVLRNPRSERARAFFSSLNTAH